MNTRAINVKCIRSEYLTHITYIISPILFTIYTADCRSCHDNIPIIKYADDTSIQGLIQNQTDINNYIEVIDNFVSWCDSHFLELNVKKTKEMIIDFRIKSSAHQPIVIKGETVEQVSEYKYLGTTFDSKLEWHPHATNVFKKINQRMYFVRKLNSFNIDKTIISMFCRSTIISVITFCIIVWGGNCKAAHSKRFDRLLRKIAKITREQPNTFDNLLINECKKKLQKILKDTTHPIFQDIEFSPRSGRLLHLRAQRERFKNSFLPLAIRHS